jgi:1-acyl-sn-glycerol-3-phosphate acyltransferase
MKIFLPHVMGARIARLTMNRGRTSSPPARLDERDPEFLAAVFDFARWMGRTWFRFRTEGLHNIPEQGPALMVGNHSGGLMVYDSLMTFMAVFDHLGPDRAMYGMGHDALQWDPILRKYAGRFGALSAGHDSAGEAFDKGHLVMVYPGSEYDSFRPFFHRSQVEFAGRTGFVRLALRNRVPIVPVVGVGGQETFVVLARGERLASMLDLHHRLRADVMPVAIALPWGLTSGLLPYIPLPAQITVSFLPPIRFDSLEPEDADDEQTVMECYHRVRRVMQEELTRLHEGRIPVLGRLPLEHRAG